MASPSPGYTRRDLPQELQDLAAWPQVDTSHLPPDVQDLVGRRQRAIRAYLQGHALSQICSDSSIVRSDIVRCLNRCLTLHEDGRIYGWRALLPYQHTRAYVRLAGPKPGKHGNAGAFRQFMGDHPEIAEPLDQVILSTKEIDAVRESRYSHAETYAHFNRLCRRAGISDTRYPLNTGDNGRRAVRRYARTLLKQHFAQGAARIGGPDARIRASIGLGKGPRLTAETPFDLVSLDAHRLNFIGCIGIPTPGRVELLPIHRMQFLPLIEHYSRAVLGYHVAIAREPGALEVIKATRNALTPWKPRALSLPDQRYPEGAMMPSAALPEAIGLCWNALLVDNASIHCSIDVAEGLRKRLGCAVNFGPVRRWYRRPLVESLFSALERAGFLRIPNTTGTGPHDPRRIDAAAKAVEHHMLIEEMLDLIDIVVCTYNATAREQFGHTSPLERLCDAVLGASNFWLPRTLPPLPPWVPDLGVIVLTKTVRGSREQGIRPYVQYEHARYANPILSKHYDLIGQQIRMHVKPDEDLRTAKAFLLSGEEIGVLTASSGWHRTAHDLALRKNVVRAIRDKTLVVAPGEDPIAAFSVLKAKQALARRAALRSRRHAISPEATALARAVQVSALPVPMVPAGAPSAPIAPVSPAPEETPPPSFVPRVRHRGVVK